MNSTAYHVVHTTTDEIRLWYIRTITDEFRLWYLRTITDEIRLWSIAASISPMTGSRQINGRGYVGM